MLRGKVALVTGASRGIGRGIALQLGEAGATVYITGRQPNKSNNPDGNLPTLEKTAQEVTSRGGKGIPVYCDHSNSDDVKKLFEDIKTETDGQLDILVNNAYSAVGCDRLAGDMAHELRKHNVASVSLWPGAVKTELVSSAVKDGGAEDFLKGFSEGSPTVMKEMFDAGETPEYSGKCVVHLAADPNVMRKTGRVLMTADLGDEYGFSDTDGRKPMNIRSVQAALRFYKWEKLSGWVPSWIKVPGWMMTVGSNKL